MVEHTGLNQDDIITVGEMSSTTMAQGNGWSAVFWCNHDQPRAVSRFGDDKHYRTESAKMLALVIHGMRGTPYIYQGEELGMTNAYFDSIEQYRDVESIHYFDILREKGISKEEVYQVQQERSRDNSRTPMQWDDSPNGGFALATPWIPVNANYKVINVKNEQNQPDSIYSLTKN